MSMKNDKYIEYKNEGSKNQTINQTILEKSKPYVHDIASDISKHLIMKITFISLKDNGESQLMHSKSDNIQIMIGNDTHEITGDFLNYWRLLNRYQMGLD